MAQARRVLGCPSIGASWSRPKVTRRRLLSRSGRPGRKLDARPGPGAGPPPWPAPSATASTSERTTTPGLPVPRVVARTGMGLRSSPVSGVDGRPTGAQGRTHPDHRPSRRNAIDAAGVTCPQANALGRGGANGRGRSRLRQKRPRGSPSRGRSSRAALDEPLGGLLALQHPGERDGDRDVPSSSTSGWTGWTSPQPDGPRALGADQGRRHRRRQRLAQRPPEQQPGPPPARTPP
jgi:hypothetical protein